MRHLVLCFSSSCSLLYSDIPDPYSDIHSIHVFLSGVGRPSFTPIENSKKN
jgi:hypothetical protein